MLDIFDFYDKMERSNILLSFKGEITPELLNSILRIMESKLENLEEQTKTKRKVYNVLVECLQNLLHHNAEFPLVTMSNGQDKAESTKTAIFMIGKVDGRYSIITANYIHNHKIEKLEGRLSKINSLDREGLRSHYLEVLNDGKRSEKGGGGLGFIDIARKSGNKLDYEFQRINDDYSFFTLNIKID